MSCRLLLAVVFIVGCQPPASGYRIVVVPKGMTHEFWQSIQRGAVAAADRLTDDGIPTRIIWDGPLRERDSLAQIRIIDRRVSAQADGILLAPQHSRTMGAPVARAVAQGVPVVVIDSGLQRRDLIVKYVATDNYHGGVLAGQRLLEVLQAEGRTRPKLILLRYQVGSESTEQREKGFESVIDAAIADPNAPVKPEWLDRDHYAGATKDSALKQAAPLLNRYRDQVDGIFAVNESAAAGTLDAMRNLGLTGPNRRIRLVGFDSSEPLLQATRAGDIDGLVVQNPYRMGYLGTWVLVRYLEGDDVDPARDLTTGEYVITRDNVDQDAMRQLYDPSRQPEQVIEPPVFPRRQAPEG